MFEFLSTFFKFSWVIFQPVLYAFALFMIVNFIWFCIFKYHYKRTLAPSGIVKEKKVSVWKKIFYYFPKQYMNDFFNRETDYFYPKGIWMFCGEQGSGKTIAAVEMILRLHRMYPKSKVITNFGLTTEDDNLSQWQQLLTYNNGHQGVIVGIDEIQNWFMSGKNQLPEGMLEIVTQNRKNNRIIVCTAQVFTRVSKGLREQVSMVLEPHTILGCLTVVFKRKPVFDSEGNVLERKYRGCYCFVHDDVIRKSYDTYRVIHTLAREGFKQQIPENTTNIYIAGNDKKSRGRVR